MANFNETEEREEEGEDEDEEEEFDYLEAFRSIVIEGRPVHACRMAIQRCGRRARMEGISCQHQ